MLRRANPFARKIDNTILDLNWNLKKSILKDLYDLNEAKHTIEGLLRDTADIHSEHPPIRLPVVTLMGMESAGKSTLINRIIGVCISNSDMGTCTIVPIRFRLHPTSMIDEDLDIDVDTYAPDSFDNEFRISYNGNTYYKNPPEGGGNLTSFQNDFNNKMKSMKNGTLSKQEQIVRIYGRGLPHIELVDLPGSKGIKHDPEIHQITMNHLKRGGENDLIIIVHSISSQNGLDEVAKAVCDHVCEGLETEAQRREKIRELVQSNRVICIATCMDMAAGGYTDPDTKLYNQIEICDIRTSVGGIKDNDSIHRYLPNVKWLYTVSTNVKSLGEEQTQAETAYFNSIITLLEKAHKMGQDEMTEEESERSKQHIDFWKSITRQSCGISQVRNQIIDYYINNINNQSELLARRVSRVIIDTAKEMRDKFHWYDPVRNNEWHERDPDADEKLTRSICEYTSGNLNNEFRHRIFANAHDFLEFPNCQTVEDGKRLLESLKDKYVKIVNVVLNENKRLKPYHTLRDIIYHDVTETISAMILKGQSELSDEYTDIRDYGEVIQNAEVDGLFRLNLHIKLTSKLRAILYLNLLDVEKIPATYQKNLQTTDEFNTLYIRYQNAWKSLITLSKLFKRIDNYDEIVQDSIIPQGVVPTTIQPEWATSSAIRTYLKDIGIQQPIPPNEVLFTTREVLNQVNTMNQELMDPKNHSLIEAGTRFDSFDIKAFFQKMNQNYQLQQQLLTYFQSEEYKDLVLKEHGVNLEDKEEEESDTVSESELSQVFQQMKMMSDRVKELEQVATRRASRSLLRMSSKKQ